MFEHVVPLRWRDSDALGHVNHAVFLTYLEVGRDAFVTEVLRADPEYVIVRVELDFRAEVRLEARTVTVGIEVETVGTTSLTTRERVILPSGEVAAEARVVMVQWDVASHSPRAFTAEERAALEASRGLTGV